MVKRKHQLLTESERDQILAIPTDRDHLARLYSFEPSDIDIIGARGSVANMGHGRAASPSWGIRQHWRNAY